VCGCLRLRRLQLGTLGTLTLPQIGDGLSKQEVITIKVRRGVPLTDALTRRFVAVSCPHINAVSSISAVPCQGGG
jgi:hypothetical protein